MKMLSEIKKIVIWCATIYGIGMIIFLTFKNPFIFPNPNTILRIMAEQVQDKDFYISILYTLTLVMSAVLCSFIGGIFLASISQLCLRASNWIETSILTIRTIPNITLLIVLLFWLDREQSIFWVLFLVLFPIVYQNCHDQFLEIDQTWKPLFVLYPQSNFYKLKNVYLPLGRSALLSSFLSIVALGFKVGVMAEILSQVSLGIGKKMQYAKLNVDLASVLAWTIWLLLIVNIVVFLIRKGVQWIQKQTL